MKLQINEHSRISKPSRFPHYFPGFIFQFLLFCSITLVALIFFIRFLFTPSTGLVDNYPEAIYYQGQMIFSPRAFFSPAAAAGLMAGQDIITAVKDHPVRSSRDLVTAAYSIKSSAPFPVKISRQGKESLILEITPQLNLMRIDWLFMFLLSFILGFTGFYILFHYKGNRAYDLLACACVFYLLVVNVKPFFYENTLSITLIHIGTFTPWLLVFFCLYTPQPKGKKAIRIGIMSIIVSCYVFFAVFRIYCIYQWCLTGDEAWYIQFRSMGKYNNVANGIAYLVFILLLWHSYRIAPAMKDKNQYQWLIVGFIISLSLYYCIEELPFIIGEVPGERIGSGNLSLLFLIPVPLFFLIGEIWNRKISVKSLQIGFMLHFFLLVFIFFFFFVLYTPIKNYLTGNNGLPDNLSSFSTMLILFVLLFPVYLIINKLLKSFFYRKNYKNSMNYNIHLETANAELKWKVEQLMLGNTAQFQAVKIAEFKHLVKGIAAKVKHSGLYIKKGLETFKRYDYTLSKHLEPEQGNYDDYEIYTGAVAFIKQGYLGIKNLFERISPLFSNNPQVCSSVDPAFLIRKAVHICTRKYPDLVPDLDLKTDKKLYGCPDEIIFALSALLFNAYEAKAAPGVKVQVKMKAKADKFIVEISDEGAGIPSIYRKRIYNPFFSTKADHDGLGLYLARIYIEKNSGSLDYRNNEKHGCVFTVTFSG